MEAIKDPDDAITEAFELSDDELLKLFHVNPERAWTIFIERYADVMVSYLRGLGFSYDQAMERFVYVCEKLCEDDYRRLKAIRYAGSHGELVPWVRKVSKHLCINWAQSEEGRNRLLKPIARLSEREQQIFALYFWKGLLPSEIFEQLRAAAQVEISYLEVLNALESIFSRLGHKKLWRLMSNLSRKQGAISLDALNERQGLEFVAASANPEEVLIQKEGEQQVVRALDGLSPKERLVIQFRYEDQMAVKEIAEMLTLKEREIKNLLKSALSNLRKAMR